MKDKTMCTINDPQSMFFFALRDPEGGVATPEGGCEQEGRGGLASPAAAPQGQGELPTDPRRYRSVREPTDLI